MLVAQIQVGQPEVGQRLRAARRRRIGGHELFELRGALGILLLRDVAASQLVGGFVGIVAARSGDLPQGLLLLVRAAQDAERHGPFVAGVLLFGRRQGDGFVILPHGLLETAVGIGRVAQPVVGVGAVTVARRPGGEELSERSLRLPQVVAVEGAVTEIVPRQRILPLGAGRTLQVGVVFGRRHRVVALCEGDFTLPEGIQRGVLGADVHRGGFREVTLRRTHVARLVGLQSAEIGDLLQRRADVGVARGHLFDGPVRGIVVAGVVVSGDQQRTGLLRTRRRRIAFDIARQHVDRAVEGAAAQFVLQFGVVEQRVLGHRRVERLVGSHRESLHRRLLVPGAQVTVGQVVGGVLRQRVFSAARLAQPLRGLRIAGRAVEREALQVAGVAVHLPAGLPESREVLQRPVEILQPEPRFGDHALQLGAPLGNGPAGQRLAVFDHIAVVALAELDLHEVIGNHVAVGVAAQKRREGLLRTAVTPFGVVDIGLVVTGVIGVFAAAADTVEIVVRLPVVAPGERDVAHADVVLLAARRAQRLVIGLRESLAGLFHVPRGAVERTECETHVVGVDRFGITLREFAQGPFGIGAAQLHGAGGQVKIRLLGQQAVRRRQHRPDAQEFLPGVAPAAVIEQVAGAPREGLYFRPGSLRAEGARRKGKGQQ